MAWLQSSWHIDAEGRRPWSKLPKPHRDTYMPDTGRMRNPSARSSINPTPFIYKSSRDSLKGQKTSMDVIRRNNPASVMWILVLLVFPPEVWNWVWQRDKQKEKQMGNEGGGVGNQKRDSWRNSSLNNEQHSHVVLTRTTEMKSRQYNLMMVLHHFWVSFHCYGMTEQLIHHSRVPILHFTEKKSYYTRVRKYWKNHSENDINERWEKQLKPGQTVSLICDGWRLQRQFVPLAQQSKEMNGVHKRENVRLIPKLNLQLSAYPYCFAAHGLSTKGPLWCAPDMWWKSGVPTEIGFAAPPLLSLSCSPTLRVPSRRSECSLAGVRLLKRKGI